MDKKILLIQPPIFKSEMVVDEIQGAYWEKLDSQMNRILEETNLSNGVDGYHAIEPNIGLLYIASSLKKAGCLLEYIDFTLIDNCLLYTSPSPRDYAASRMPSSA